MSVYANASQMGTPSRALLPNYFLGSVAPLVKNCDFFKNMTFNLQAAVPYTLKFAEGEQQNCSNSVQKLAMGLKISPFEMI